MLQSIHLLLADKHAIFCNGFQYELYKYLKLPIVIIQANSIQDMLNCCQQQSPDVLLLSHNIIADRPITSVIKVQQHMPCTKIILLLTEQGTISLRETLKMNISGCVLKSDSTSTIMTAVKIVLDGHTYFSQTAWHQLIKNQKTENNSHKITTSPISLSERDQQLLTLLEQGCSNHQIAQELHLAYQTVRNNLNQLYKKLGVHSRFEAFSWVKDNRTVLE